MKTEKRKFKFGIPRGWGWGGFDQNGFACYKHNNLHLATLTERVYSHKLHRYIRRVSFVLQPSALEHLYWLKNVLDSEEIFIEDEETTIGSVLP